ncbi:MAG: serine/threonine protein kinase [Phycisphaerae bacterium]|nr:serine/threonine protein kinase [Phycisphaerae bacterium]
MTETNHPYTPAGDADTEAIFHAVLDARADEGAALLARLCGEDMILKARIESLLGHDRQAGEGFLGGLAEDALTGAVEGSPDGPGSKQIGRYRILRVLGEGGMGVVYEAEQDHPRRRVAIKLVRSAFASRSVLARFEREAAALGRMRHPGIAQIYEAGTASDAGGGSAPYFAMELVEGPSLDVFVRERAPGVRMLLGLVADIAEIVQYAHERGVVHRDLKPANIHVETAPDGSWHPKVLDFGIARIMEATGTDTAGAGPASLRTDMGQLLGTLPYMSPEQVAGEPEAIDARSDVYALGVLLFELLSGKLPLDVRGRPIAEAARIIRDGDPMRLSTIDRAFRGDIETIVARAMEKDPDRRYPSAAAMAEDLRRHLRDAPILARPTSRIEQAMKFVRRHRTLVTAATLVILATSTGAVVSTGAWLRAERERASAERRYDIASELSELIRRDVVDVLNRVPDGRAIRLSLLRKVTPFYEELSRERPGDPARIRTAWLGLIALGRDYEAVGEIELARRTLEQAEVAIRAALVATGTGTDRLLFQEDLGWALLHEGWVEHRGGDRSVAREHYADAIRELSPIVAATGKATSAGEKLALARRRLGDVLNDSGDASGAEREYLAALELDEACAAASPTSDEARMNVTRTWRRLGQLARQQGDLDAARRWLARTVEARDRLNAPALPSATVHNIAVAHQDLGAVELEAGAAADAVRSLRMGVELLERCIELEPTDVLSIQQLASCRMLLSTALERSGATDAARLAGQAAVDLAKSMLARSDPSVTNRAVAASVLIEVSPTSLREPAEALRQIEQAIAESGGEDLTMWTTKAKALHQLGRPADAADAQQRVLELLSPHDSRRRAEAEAQLAVYRK